MPVTTIRRFLADQMGATAIEYALLTVLIAVAIIGTVSVLGNSVQALFANGASEALAEANLRAP